MIRLDVRCFQVLLASKRNEERYEVKEAKFCIYYFYCGFVMPKRASLLQIGFYRNSCSLVELIVKDVVRDSFIRDHGVAAGLVKLHFSDCFVRVSKHANIFLILLALVSRFSLKGSLLHFT